MNERPARGEEPSLAPGRPFFFCDPEDHRYIADEMREEFEKNWQIVGATIKMSTSPGDTVQLNTDACWIVGPSFRSRGAAERFLADFRKLLEWITELESPA